MSKLYFTENGYVIPCLCKEVADYRRARKVLNLPQTNRDIEVYLLVRSYQGNNLPLHVSVNGNHVSSILPVVDDNYRWFNVTIPAEFLGKPSV